MRLRSSGGFHREGTRYELRCPEIISVNSADMAMIDDLQVLSLNVELTPQSPFEVRNIRATIPSFVTPFRGVPTAKSWMTHDDDVHEVGHIYRLNTGSSYIPTTVPSPSTSPTIATLSPKSHPLSPIGL